MSLKLVERYGAWALVTGAAREKGVGFAFARQLAAEGMNLVLVDILEAELTQRGAALRQQYPIEVRTVALDVAPANFIETLVAQTQDIELGLLVCNHMYTPTDTPKILDMELSVHHRMMDINARAYTTLLHTYGRQMRDRGRGALVIVGSGAGLIPTPYTGAYSANKAFQIALGEALWYELKGTGVEVVVLAAGLMNTQGDSLSGYPKFMIAEPEGVVVETLANLGKRHLVIPGWINKLFMALQLRLLPRGMAVNAIGQFMAQGLGKKASG